MGMTVVFLICMDELFYINNDRNEELIKEQ